MFNRVRNLRVSLFCSLQQQQQQVLKGLALVGLQLRRQQSCCMKICGEEEEEEVVVYVFVMAVSGFTQCPPFIRYSWRRSRRMAKPLLHLLPTNDHFAFPPLGRERRLVSSRLDSCLFRTGRSDKPRAISTSGAPCNSQLYTPPYTTYTTTPS